MLDEEIPDPASNDVIGHVIHGHTLNKFVRLSK